MKNIYIGQKFGFLTVVSLITGVVTPKRGGPSRAHVVCQCDCGKTKTIIKAQLFMGDAKTCGSLSCNRRSHDKTYKKKRNGKKSLTHKGYVRIRDNNKSYIEHRLVMEKHLNRKLRKNEVVHHINGIKNDNRIKNLEVLSSSVHSKKHTDRLIEIAQLRKKIEGLERRIEQLELERVLSTRVG